MHADQQSAIWTIGHSTHPLEKFVAMLHSFDIATLVDVRHYPGSRRYPQYNKEALTSSLQEQQIRYVHFEALGGRRKPSPTSENTAWRLPAFRGYADYMETDAFKEAVETLQTVARETRTAYMCSEAVWWSCHRSLISDYLKVKEWNVMHIMDVGKAQPHRFTAPAQVIDGQLSYKPPLAF
ncbi:MAG: DUF488 domain-containing protein [Chitinophagaceae bacterium]|nr:MAG: DUF488 domain-containing protein [Chitinophagaceae bacterium]